MRPGDLDSKLGEELASPAFHAKDHRRCGGVLLLYLIKILCTTAITLSASSERRVLLYAHVWQQ